MSDLTVGHGRFDNDNLINMRPEHTNPIKVDKQADKNYKDFKRIENIIIQASGKAGITLEQAIKFMDAFKEEDERTITKAGD